MSEPSKDVPEPSMEEILSSIRRIIAEEDDTAQPRSPLAAEPAPPPASGPAGDDVLELTDRIDDGRGSPAGPGAPASPASSGKPPAGGKAAAPAKASSEQPEEAAATPPVQEQPLVEPAPLVSSTAAAASAAALAKLARAAAPAPAETAHPISGMTVEQLLTSMLEPMLKEWFDKNLPAVVERIVQDEVKKLVRRAELQ
ncbi:DUF2497 domain-containing protein [Geminicoccus roseus]|uniref:DUF2497 domain-containing protein n=1 Tax=Geminicoccus roseus TaxID=404900 RepID=UPI0004297876|nr:DUF2497 domain-containing protein [Geminicoccus roseus]